MSLRFLYHHSLVRTPCRKHLHAERILVDLLVVLKGICRIISCTYNLYIESLHELLTSELRSLKLCCTLIIDSPCSLRTQKVIYAEDSCELEVSPVVERVSHCIWNSLRPLLELLVAVTSSGDEFFRNTVATHSSPFIMVTSEPHLGKVSELIVVSYHLRHKVAVIVDDRHLLCALVIELASIIIGEHEVVIDKRFPVHLTICF